jgi:FMN-dependent oxidoreductase (nitrilotriacetate monooxygenase family)
MKKKKIHLAFDLSWTTVETHWRLPDSWVDRHHPNIGMFEEVARTAERGGFDMIFFGDSTGIPDTWKGSIEDAVRHGVAWPRFEMSPWITKMSTVTSHLGFGLTYASTFMHPFYTARLLNSLDHITNGRIAFNVITSQRRADYANYGYDELPDHNERYDRLEEFIDVCRALWSSVDADAFVWDRRTGTVADPSKVRPINHLGKSFKVKGPLSVVPSPQGQPVIIQAGASGRGRDFAAKHAEVIFAIQPFVEGATAYYRDVKQRMVELGRRESDCKILFGVQIFVAETASAARDKRDLHNSLVPLEGAVAHLSGALDTDLSGLSLDSVMQPFEATRSQGVVDMYTRVAGRTLTLREMALRHGQSVGFPQVVGTPEQVADQLEDYYERAGGDGFMLTMAYAPGALEEFVSMVVPVLQGRGRLRTDYRGSTLREILREDG